MAAREVERAELHKTIWRMANDLRGSVDGWDFKAYVLGMLFYRFISENLTAYLNEQERRATSKSAGPAIQISITPNFPTNRPNLGAQPPLRKRDSSFCPASSSPMSASGRIAMLITSPT